MPNQEKVKHINKSYESFPAWSQKTKSSLFCTASWAEISLVSKSEKPKMVSPP